MKKDALIREITEYLPFDRKLNDSEKEDFVCLLKNNQNDFTPWMKTIYDYFDSHILSGGEIVSLEVFRESNPSIDFDYYKSVNDAFVSELFKQNRPLYFLDVDNTLTDLGVLSEEKKSFISSFEGRNRIILSSGKNYLSILNTIEDLNISGNYSSTINGSVLCYQGSYETVNKLGDVSEELLSKLLKTGLSVITYYNDKIHLVKDLTQENIDLLNKYHEYYIDDSRDTKYGDIIKILAFIYEGDCQKEDIVKNIVKDYPDLVSLRTAWHTYEILRRDQHKGNTVKEIAKRMGYYYRCSVGVGDSMNDLQMLNYVGVPKIVSTSSEDLRKYNFEALSENRETDIVDLIKEYK